MSEEINIIICGIAGQGIVLAERVLSEAAFAEGQRVFTADVPPISQRFAPVYSYVRIGDEIYSLNFPEGEADLVLGFEPLQCLKFGLTFGREGGLILMNNRVIDMRPDPTYTYPALEEIEGFFRKIGIKTFYNFNASEVAIEITGNIMTMSMVMLGASFATGIIPVQKKSLQTAIENLSPRKTIELNLQAFEGGIKKLDEVRQEGR